MTASQARQARVLIVGAGAIGGFYGAALQRGGAEVSLACRSEYDVVRAHGYHVESTRHGDSVLRPAQTVRSASDYQGGPPDYLILSVKVVHGVDRAALIRAAVGPDTTIVLIENGVEIEAEIAQAFPANELISALAFVQVSRTAPGRIRHYAFGELTFGNYPSGLSERCRQFATLLENGGIACTPTDNVVAARWAKCLWNAAFNPASVLGGALDTDDMLGTTQGEALVRRAMQEVRAVAHAAGYPLAPELVDQYIAGTRKAPPYKTSMALDYLHGRPMEIEAIIGNAVRAAQRVNVAVPTLETLYALLKMVERKTGKGAQTDCPAPER